MGFTDESESEDEDAVQDDHEDAIEREQGLAMQISPRRSTGVSAPVLASWASTPLHHPVLGSGSPAGGAHNLLQIWLRRWRGATLESSRLMLATVDVLG